MQMSATLILRLWNQWSKKLQAVTPTEKDDARTQSYNRVIHMIRRTSEPVEVKLAMSKKQANTPDVFFKAFKKARLTITLDNIGNNSWPPKNWKSRIFGFWLQNRWGFTIMPDSSSHGFRSSKELMLRKERVSEYAFLGIFKAWRRHGFWEIFLEIVTQ